MEEKTVFNVLIPESLYWKLINLRSTLKCRTWLEFLDKLPQLFEESNSTEESEINKI